MLLLRDLAEVQLPYMSNHTAKVLYSASLQALYIFKNRFQNYKTHATATHTITSISTTTNTNNNNNNTSTFTTNATNNILYDEFETEFKSDVLLYTMELLNHLVTKDFDFLSENVTQDENNGE